MNGCARPLTLLPAVSVTDSLLDVSDLEVVFTRKRRRDITGRGRGYQSLAEKRSASWGARFWEERHLLAVMGLPLKRGVRVCGAR